LPPSCAHASGHHGGVGPRDDAEVLSEQPLGQVLIGSSDVIDVPPWDSLAGIRGVPRTTTSSPASSGVTAVLSQPAAARSFTRLQLLLRNLRPILALSVRLPMYFPFDTAAFGRDPDCLKHQRLPANL
jgi:hypothetical protein